jgi:hypothetical protein
MTEHGDFRYIGTIEPTRAEAAAPERKPRTPAAIARDAASLCWRIRNEQPDPAKWKPLIEAADPELHECLREYLKQAFRELKERARRQEGKRTEAGDAAMAELGRRYGR